jgi:arylsulfatase
VSYDQQDRPNVLLVCVDHWPGNLLGSAGHPCVMTPTLDQLASNGVRFTNAYSASPTCVPARRGLLTGTTARTHGDRVFSERMPMPDIPTMAQSFSEAGYQTFAVGKLHVYPQRLRLGFDDVILNEEGRHHLEGRADDYELFLAAEGYAGMEYGHGMPTTDYLIRPYHLPEYLHPTNWTVREMSRVIRRRDPTRPAFWYLSFNAPHPPLVPLRDYMDMYRDADIPEAAIGEWADVFDELPFALQQRFSRWYALLQYENGRTGLTAHELKLVRQAFYAMCTHVDHQIRLVIGQLREEGLLDNTIIAFTSDHGDMLGDHQQFAKGLLYDASSKVPFIVMDTAAYNRLGHHQEDGRLAELRDMMPTLLDMAGIPIPDSVEGISLLSNDRRDVLYGEHYEGDDATRIVRVERYKLIYYPTGNHLQLFDLLKDPQEVRDLSDDPDHANILVDLRHRLVDFLYGDDLNWLEDGELIGRPDKPYQTRTNRGLTAQRGLRFM